MEPIFFQATWERKILLLTLVFSVILLGTAGALLAAFFIAHAPVLPMAFFLPAIFVLVFVLAPRGYLLTAEDVRVVRLAGDIRVKLADIAQVEVAEGQSVFRGAMRVGSGGAFGIYGRYYSDTLPEFQAYVTTTGRLLVIRRPHDVPLVISPDDVDGFLQRIGERGIIVSEQF